MSFETVVLLGTANDIEDLVKEVEKRRFAVDPMVKSFLDLIPVAPEFGTADVKVKTLKELGFNNGAEFPQIVEKILGLGRKAPAEVAFQLRMAHWKQKFDEHIRLVMDPIVHAKGESILSVYRSYSEPSMRIGSNRTVPSSPRGQHGTPIWGKTTSWAWIE